MPQKKKSKIAAFYNGFVATKGRPLPFKIFVTLLVIAMCLMLLFSMISFIKEGY